MRKVNMAGVRAMWAANRIKADWDSLPLGKVHDTVIARQLGCDESTVRSARRARGVTAAPITGERKKRATTARGVVCSYCDMFVAKVDGQRCCQECSSPRCDCGAIKQNHRDRFTRTCEGCQPGEAKSLVGQVISELRVRPGQGWSDLAETLGIPQRNLYAPIKELRQLGRVRTVTVDTSGGETKGHDYSTFYLQ